VANRSVSSFLVGVVLVGAALGGTGCRAPRGLPPAISAAPELPSPGRLLARLDDERTRLRGLRTLADSELTGPEGHFRASEVLLVEPPARLRIEVLSMFGVAWVLATDGHFLDIYSREEGTVYRGEPNPALLADYLPVPLALEELTELLLGRPPRREVVASEGVAWEQETGFIRLVLRIAGGGTEILWFDAVSGLLMRCEERDAKGALRFDLRIKAYRDVSGALLGSDITILAADGVQVRLAYAKSELNPTLPAELFRLRNVMGVKEVRLGDRGHWR
jgi:hypothetical protein